MFQVKPMSPADYDFAVALANTMDWNMAAEDFQFAQALEKDGCLVAFDGSTRVGIATCISYGKVGWFGNLIVKEKYRRKGVGGLLVKQALAHMTSRGVKTVGLYAYPGLVDFYSGLGFTRDDDFSVLHAENLCSLSAERLPIVGPDDVRDVCAFDLGCFVGDRKRLLESVILEGGNLAFFKREKGEVVGYVAATVYEKVAWVGPLVAHAGRVDVAVALVKAVLAPLAGKGVYAVVGKGETGLSDVFFDFGFKEDFDVVRMFLGEAVAKNCLYMAESLERG